MAVSLDEALELAAWQGVSVPPSLPDDDRWRDDIALIRTRPGKKTDAHYVYVVTSGAGHVKIGRSKNPKGRVTEMQVGSPIGLDLAHTWKTTRDGAVQMEKSLHRCFKWAATHGEWFNILGREVIDAGNLLMDGRPHDMLRLIALFQERREMEAKQDRLKRAWYYCSGRPRERAEAERAGKAALPPVKQRLAQIELECLDLGHWMHRDVTTRWGREDLKYIRLEAGLVQPHALEQRS